MGIPPIGANARFWRETWNGRTRREKPVVEVTAESLFGVPSGEALEPALALDGQAGLQLRALGIKGRVAEEIVTLIVKNEIPWRAWEGMLAEADRDHNRNREDRPGKYSVNHCGFLFKRMLVDHLERESFGCLVDARRSPMSHSEMEADTLLVGLRMTLQGKRQLREAVKAEKFELRDGRVVPCWLNWSKVVEVLKATGKDFTAFKKGIAARIFKGKPDSEWYDAWMALEQIPTQNDKPLEEKKMEAKDRNLVRVHAAMIAKSKYGEGEEVARKHLANDLIRLASWQTPGRSVAALKEALDDISRVLLKTPDDSSSFDPDPLDPLLIA